MPSSDSGDDIPLDDPPEINPYEVLGVEKTATEKDIKTAYRRAALKHHPDKGGSHTTFQELAFAYAILSTPSRRTLYDSTGRLDPPDPLDDSDGFNWRDFYREQHKDVISEASIQKDKEAYQGSDEERADLLRSFEKFHGAIGRIYQEIIHSDPVDDEARFRAIFDAAIQSGEAEAYPAYVNETDKSKKARMRAARREEQEAKELAREIGVDESFVGGNGKGKGKGKGGADDALKALIMKRGEERAQGRDDFFARLEAKYGGGAGGGGKKQKAKKVPNAQKGKKRARVDGADGGDENEDGEEEDGDGDGDGDGDRDTVDEPPEEAFAAMAERAARRGDDKENGSRASKKRTLKRGTRASS